MKRAVSHLERSLYRKLGQAVRDYQLLKTGDRVMVCMSGGKDSYALLYFLDILRRRSPVKFEVVAAHLDQGQPGYDGKPLVDYLEAHGYEYRILRKDTYSIVKEKTLPGQAYCFMCSRLRRGVLYDAAVDLGCNKLALGHHRDDALETLFLNLIFSGQLKSMPPKLVSDDGRNTVIRPLIYCAEQDLAHFSLEQGFPILPCNLCGTQENLQREAMKKLLNSIEAANPGARGRMLAALCNVRPSHTLDQGLWNRLGIPGLAEGVPALQTPKRPAHSEPTGPAQPFEVAAEDEDSGDYAGGEPFSADPIPFRLPDPLGILDE